MNRSWNRTRGPSKKIDFWGISSGLVYVRPQSTARMHHPFVDMEAGCSDDDDNAHSDDDGWSTMISGELCDDEACIGTCYDDINEVGDCAIDIECGNDV